VDGHPVIVTVVIVEDIVVAAAVVAAVQVEDGNVEDRCFAIILHHFPGLK
jgi:hypothetical protein